jgi:hypothetical protein
MTKPNVGSLCKTSFNLQYRCFTQAPPQLLSMKGNARSKASSFFRHRRVLKPLAVIGLGTIVYGTFIWYSPVITENQFENQYLHQINSIFMGFYRSILTILITNSIILDYKWLYFQNGDLGIESDEYKRLRSIVHKRRYARTCVDYGMHDLKCSVTPNILLFVFPRETLFLCVER